MAKTNGDKPQETNSQAIEGYKCSCGYTTDQKGLFNAHIMLGSKKEGKGTHKSMGRVNLLTGESTMPPCKDRTKEQLAASVYSPTRQAKIKQAAMTTDILNSANEIKFVPRIYTCTFTPIMQAARAAATKIWGWREDMPLENFLDTVLYYFYKEHGIQLGGYIVDDDIISEEVEPEEEVVNG